MITFHNTRRIVNREIRMSSLEQVEVSHHDTLITIIEKITADAGHSCGTT